MNTFDLNTPMIERHRNLRTLMNFISDLPHDKLHMPAWVSKDATEHSCGTAGCACGWAATIFNKQGWTIGVSVDRSQDIPYLLAEETYLKTAEAFAVFFGISEQYALAITMYFDGAHYDISHNDKEVLSVLGIHSYARDYNVPPDKITPVMVADRIRKVLELVAPDVLKEPECTSIRPSLKLNGEVSCENLQSSCPS